MSDLKIAIIGDEKLDILDENAPQQLKEADFWQLTTDEDLKIPNYTRAILLDEELTNLKSEIADNILWQAKEVIFVLFTAGYIPSIVTEAAMQMAKDANIKYSVIQVKPFIFEGRKRIDLYKEIKKLLEIQTGYENMKIIDSNDFVKNLPAKVNEIIEKRNEEIKNTLKFFTI